MGTIPDYVDDADLEWFFLQLHKFWTNCPFKAIVHCFSLYRSPMTHILRNFFDFCFYSFVELLTLGNQVLQSLIPGGT
jgi:hypothetical protein